MLSYLDVVIVAGAITAGVAMAIFLVVQGYVTRWKSEVTSGNESRWKADRAFNSLNAARALLEVVRREGGAVADAEALISRAQMKYDARRFEECSDLTRNAQEKLAKARKVALAGTPPPSMAPTNPPVPKAPRAAEPPGLVPPGPGVTAPAAIPPRRGLPLESETTPPADAAEVGSEEGASELERFKMRMPRNDLEARFLLRSLKDDLAHAGGSGVEASRLREAQNWAARSDQAFERKDYTDSLRLAIRGRRTLEGSGPVTGIPVSPGTVVETPAAQPSSSLQRSSGPLAPASVSAGAKGASTLRCARCGRENLSSDRFCRGCGGPLNPPRCPRCQAEMTSDDAFCGSCGAPLGA